MRPALPPLALSLVARVKVILNCVPRFYRPCLLVARFLGTATSILARTPKHSRNTNEPSPASPDRHLGLNLSYGSRTWGLPNIEPLVSASANDRRPRTYRLGLPVGESIGTAMPRTIEADTRHQKPSASLGPLGVFRYQIKSTSQSMDTTPKMHQMKSIRYASRSTMLASSDNNFSFTASPRCPGASR
jgi:hypothetical protein